MNLTIRSNVSSYLGSKCLYCVFADIRSLSTLLSCPLVNGHSKLGVLHTPLLMVYWAVWYWFYVLGLEHWSSSYHRFLGEP